MTLISQVRCRCKGKSGLTNDSSRLATMDANLCSPARSEISRIYSGALTWLDLEKKQYSSVLVVDMVRQQTFISSIV